MVGRILNQIKWQLFFILPLGIQILEEENYYKLIRYTFKYEKMSKIVQNNPISISQNGQIVSTDAENTGSFLCAHDPYFTLIQEPELEPELLTITENEFEEAINDTIAENDGFVAPNYDYVTTLAPMKTVEDIDGDNFINARIQWMATIRSPSVLRLKILIVRFVASF